MQAWTYREFENVKFVWHPGNDAENRAEPSRPTWCHASAEDATHARGQRVETHLLDAAMGHVRPGSASWHE